MDPPPKSTKTDSSSSGHKTNKGTYEQQALESSTYVSLRSAMVQAQLKAESEMKGPSGANYAYDEFVRGHTEVLFGKEERVKGIYERLGTGYLRDIESQFEIIREATITSKEQRYSDVVLWVPDMENTPIERLRKIEENWRGRAADIEDKVRYHTDIYIQTGGSEDTLLGYYQDQSATYSRAIWALHEVISDMEGAYQNIPALHAIVEEAVAIPPSERFEFIRSHRKCVAASY